MTTNDIQALRDGRSCVTVLTSPTAKIVQVFTVLARPDELLLLPARGEMAALARHLRGQIFFMDKVTVVDLSAEYARVRLMGPQANTVLAAVGLDMQAAVDGEWRRGEGVLAVFQAQYDLPGYELLIEQPQHADVLAKMTAAGAVILGAEDAYEARRIELGRPRPGAELSGEYNPLEAGLGWACAENKGCYTGQEIIARQVTYDKVTRHLVGIAAGQMLAAGAPLTAGGREVGTVTSAAYSPARKAPVALAIVKRPHDALGTQLVCGEQAVAVADLPLAD
jgi:folate-binding protein YgfZ